MSRWPPARERVLDVRTLKVSAFGGGGLVWTQPGWLHSVVLTGPDVNTAANLTMWDGRDGNGEPLGIIRAAMTATAIAVFGYPGVPLHAGLFVTLDVAAATGAITVSREIDP